MTHPWKTIAKYNALSFSPDDHVYWNRGDTFADAEMVPPSSGIDNHNIYHGAYGSGNRPVIGDGGSSLNQALYIATGGTHHLDFHDLDFSGAHGGTYDTVTANSHDLWFEDCDMRDSDAHMGFGAWSYDGSDLYNVVLNRCHAHDNEWTGIYIGSSLGSYGPHDCLITNCEADHNGVWTDHDHGIYVKFGVVVEYNYCHDNPVGGGIKANCQTVHGSAHNPTLRYNTVTNNYIGLYVGEDLCTIHHNLVYGNTHYNMILDADALNNHIYWNTLVNVVTGGSGNVYFNSVVTGNILENNIFCQDAAVYSFYEFVFGAGVSIDDFVVANTFDYNTYYTDGVVGTNRFYSSSGSKSWTTFHALTEAHGSFLSAVPDFTARYTNLKPVVGNLSGLGVAVGGYTKDLDGATIETVPTPGCYITQSVFQLVSATVGPVNKSTVVMDWLPNVLASNYATGITIKEGGATKTISSATRQADNSKVYFVLSAKVAQGASVTIEYNAAVGDYRDPTSAYTMPSFGATTVTNTVNDTANLEVPIEMIDQGIYCVAAAAAVASFSQIHFDISNYDGTITAYFETVCRNNHASIDYDVILYDVTNSGTLATISIPHGQANYTRQRSGTITFAAGNNILGVSCPQVALDGNVVIMEARLVIIQVGATKTRIQYQLASKTYIDYSNSTADGSDDTTTSTSYTQYHPDLFNMWLKNTASLDTIAAGTPWTFEALLFNSDAPSTTSLALYNKTSGNAVTGAELSRAGSSPTLVSVNLANNAIEFTDQDIFEVRLKASANIAKFANAYLYINLSAILKAEIVYRVGRGWTGTAANAGGQQRMLYTAANYSPGTIYAEFVGYCADNAQAGSLQQVNSNVLNNGSDITGATVNWNSATKARYRTAAITPTTTYTIYQARPATTATDVLTVAEVIIDIDNS
jgi:parallel beta-helix repeat protein